MLYAQLRVHCNVSDKYKDLIPLTLFAVMVQCIPNSCCLLKPVLVTFAG